MNSSLNARRIKRFKRNEKNVIREKNKIVHCYDRRANVVKKSTSK